MYVIPSDDTSHDFAKPGIIEPSDANRVNPSNTFE